jgi:hypothetical protein
MLSALKKSLFEQKSAKGINLFRIFFGVVLFAQTLWFIQSEFIQENFIDSKLRVPFTSLLNPLPETGLKLLLLVMLASSVGIIISKFYKLSIVIFCLAFTYFWLLDKSYFNNHYYFISLMVFLMFFIKPTQESKSTLNINGSVPYWQIFILKAQVFIVFFIAGLHKINYYWIVEFQPMKHILETKAQVSDLSFLASNGMYAFFSWSGLLFDIGIGFLLWSRKTRKIGFVLFVCFNLLNFWLFYNIGEIGFFPFLLLACLPLFFFDEEAVVRKNKTENTSVNPDKKQKVVSIFIASYFLIQIILPFRYLLYDDHVDWHGKGQRFAWRMKIMYKEVDMHFYLVEEGSKDKLEVNVGNFLNDKQYTNLMYYPDFMPLVACYIKAEGEKRGLKKPKVVADFKVGFMGHKKVPLVDPKLDLSSLNDASSKEMNWILPLEQN